MSVAVQHVHTVERPSQLIRAWALADGGRCLLIGHASGFELQLISPRRPARRARYRNVHRACDTAHQWRLDYELELAALPAPAVPRLCPECGEQGWTDEESDGGSGWLYCVSCGEAWLIRESHAVRA